MGNKFSCISAQGHLHQVDVVGPPLQPDNLDHPGSFSYRYFHYDDDHFPGSEPPRSRSLHPSYPLPTSPGPYSRPAPPIPFLLPTPSVLPTPPLRPSLSVHAPQARLKPLNKQAARVYSAFLQAYPQYQNTWIIDTLRWTDFASLDRTGKTYVDYAAGAQRPESLVRVHSNFLARSIVDDIHSGTGSRLSSECADEARRMALSFFQAPRGYTVIFTPNATRALKLVGEAFPFQEGSSFILGTDSHNSTHRICEFAARRGAKVHYIPSTPTGGFKTSVAKDILRSCRPASSSTPSLFVLTGQSNISNSKSPLSILHDASSLGYSTLLDAAALAPTSVISLTETPVDAMAVSFYKMFGYPTGVGALVVKESFLATLKRPWLVGDTVNTASAPGTLVTKTAKLHEQFEDATVNYLTLSTVTDGLRFLAAYLPFLPLRLSCLMRFLTSSMAELRHDTNEASVIKILSKLPSRRLKSISEQSDIGSTVSFVVLSPTGDMIPNSFVEHVATMHNISLRTGTMCNLGGTLALLGIKQVMENLSNESTLADIEARIGRELGVVRVSLGLGSDWKDVWHVIQFLKGFGEQRQRMAWWDAWMQAQDGQVV